MMIGDGKGKTIIAGGSSVADNMTTFHTAAFAATGAGFIAKDITFENWAGAAKHQAVALRIGADHAVIYRCQIIGYQDTLYVHSQRQFYRECEIYGTVDFIFGNAAVVLQNCTIYARKPMAGQKNTITAQNRKDPNQNTGISIHASRILATSDLDSSKANFSTYLGRESTPNPSPSHCGRIADADSRKMEEHGKPSSTAATKPAQIPTKVTKKRITPMAID